MAILESITDLDVKGRILTTTVPNSTGSIVTWNSATNVLGLRTNAQIISDLGLQGGLTNGLHTALNGNKVDVAFDTDIWVKDKLGRDFFYLGSIGSNQNDTMFKRGTLNGNFKWLEANGSDLMSLSSAGVLRVNQLAGAGNRLLQADLSGSVFATNIDPDDIATETWVNANFPLKSYVYTKSETNNLLDGKANVNGNNLTNIQTWRDNLGIGVLNSLSTTDKTDLVGAINEVNGKTNNLGKKRNYFLNSTNHGLSVYRIYLPSNTVSDVIIRVNSSYQNDIAIGIIEMQLVYGTNLGAAWGSVFKCTDAFGWVKNNFYVEPILYHDAVKDRNYVKVHKKSALLNPYFIDVEIRNNSNNLTDDSVFFELDTTTPVINDVNVSYDDATFATRNGNNLTNIPQWLLNLGINNSWNLQQVTNNGNSTTLPIVIGGTEINGNIFLNANPFLFLTNTSQAQKVLSGGLLASDNYADGSLIPANGGYFKGQIATLNDGNSTIWNAKLGVGSNISLLNNDVGYITSSALGNYVNKAGDTMSGALLIGSNIIGQQRILHLAEPTYTDSYGFDFMTDTNTGFLNIYGLNNGVRNLLPNLSIDRSSGNVGIGENANTTHRLSVNGSGSFSGNVIIPNAIASNHAVAFGQLSAYFQFPSGGNSGQYLNGLGQLVNFPTIPPQLVYTGSNGISVTGTVISPTYGTTVNTIAQGNDSRINNGQTAFGWGNHAGLYPLLSGSYANPTWITALDWSKITNKPTIQTPNNGTFAVQGTGALTGSGSTSADSSANTSATLDLSTATKNDITAGKNASTQVTSLFADATEYFKYNDVSAGGSVDANEAFFNLVNPTTVSGLTIDIGDHHVNGARLVLQGVTGMGGIVTYKGRFIMRNHVNLGTLTVEGQIDQEFVWDVNENRWREVF